MDQFPHDDWPRHLDQPKIGTRSIYARAVVTPGFPPRVRVSWSPVISMRCYQDLKPAQVIAIMTELAKGLERSEHSAASRELLEVMEQAMKDWEVKSDD